MASFIEMHHRAKLTKEQVKAIRADYKPWVFGYASLAKKYGAGISTIRDICTYRTRKNVR